MLLKALIVDDEPVARKVIREYIEDIDYLELAGMAENPLKADILMNEQPVDLLFLDINMPKLSGIEFLRANSRRLRQPMTIITTAYAEYALDGFELEVADYLVKPFSFERFLKACNKVRDYYALIQRQSAPGKEEGRDHFFVKCDNRVEKILYDELVYVEARLNYIILHTPTRQLMVYLTLKSIIGQLPADQFLKVHKSFIINIRHIKSIQGNTLDLGTGEVIISQNYYDQAIKEILKDGMIKRS
ncbi:MAG TPA: LytTR family DNA-binding domain-containing protein [Puia sp.]